MPGYYDYVLGLIPLTLFGMTGSLTWVGLSLTAALPIAAAVALGIIGHAMFVRAPVATTPDRRERDEIGPDGNAPYPNAD
ncbi:hypothetical protein [Halobellus marinus]|jgi:hypothetical protein|uniref:hypothetical protein n=1 Tax=Halobellus TaxID=1073986 RepID=UPI0028B1A29C|nr:hypothetical protein [Halobellus sp. DFY28]